MVQERKTPIVMELIHSLVEILGSTDEEADKILDSKSARDEFDDFKQNVRAYVGGTIEGYYACANSDMLDRFSKFYKKVTGEQPDLDKIIKTKTKNVTEDLELENDMCFIYIAERNGEYMLRVKYGVKKYLDDLDLGRKVGFRAVKTFSIPSTINLYDNDSYSENYKRYSEICKTCDEFIKGKLGLQDLESKLQSSKRQV